MTRAFKLGAAAILTFLAVFTGTAIASEAIAPIAPAHQYAGLLAQAAPDPSLLDLLRPVYDAFAAHQYGLMGALLVIALVALAKRWGGASFPWLHSDMGGSAMALVVSAATALAAGLGTPGAHVTLELLKTAVFVGLTAAGGYAAIKNLLIDPVLRPLAAKAPAWMQPIFQLVFWVFDKQATNLPVAIAVKAGDAAVIAAPATGAAGIVGTPTEVK